MTQLNGKPLPIGGFTGGAMSQMLHDVAGVSPKEVVVMNDQEVVIELEEETPIMKVSKAIHGLFHGGGHYISVDSLVAKKDLITDIVRECEVGWERQRVGVRTLQDKRRPTRTSSADDGNFGKDK